MAYADKSNDSAPRNVLVKVWFISTQNIWLEQYVRKSNHPFNFVRKKIEVVRNQSLYEQMTWECKPETPHDDWDNDCDFYAKGPVSDEYKEAILSHVMSRGGGLTGIVTDDRCTIQSDNTQHYRLNPICSESWDAHLTVNDMVFRHDTELKLVAAFLLEDHKDPEDQKSIHPWHRFSLYRLEPVEAHEDNDT